MIAADQQPSPLIRLRSVDKSFAEAERRHRVLEAVDLDVEQGEFVALLGRSGTGKSTLLNLISGIDEADAGEVHVRGEPLHELGENERTLFRRRHIGFVFQFFNLLPTLTVAENVALPQQLNPERDGLAAPAELLERVGLADRAASFPDRLSGGEQQRVAIARALAHDPEVLLADEPTGNLDVDVGHDVLELLTGLSHDRGKTLVMATHSHEAAARADRVLRIVGHRLVGVDAGSL